MGWIRAKIEKATHGRMVKRGITVWSAMIAVVVIVGLFVGLAALQQRFATDYDLDVSVIDHEIVPTESGCEWQFQIRVSNPNDRRVSLVSFELDEVAGSTRSMLASIASLETADRTYRVTVENCEVAASERTPGRLVTTYRLTGTSSERTVTDVIG